ncbi:MAG: hypothetical protein ABI589_01840 [Burkholderiales bacterium]
MLKKTLTTCLTVALSLLGVLLVSNLSMGNKPIDSPLPPFFSVDDPHPHPPQADGG